MKVFNQKINPFIDIPERNPDITTYVSVPTPVVVNGEHKTVLQKVKLEDVDTRSQYKADDFNIQSLIDANAVDAFKECSSYSVNNLDNTDILEKQVNYINEVKSQINENNE